MRFPTLFFLLIGFLQCGSQAVFAQPPQGSQQAPADATSNLIWKAALMTGDDSVDTFDNARKTLTTEFLHMGVLPANIKELSMNPRERKHGSTASSAANLSGALRDLSVGNQDACLIHMTSHGAPQGFYLRNGGYITPQALNRILDSSCGDRPTVVLISACYSGVFVGPAMQKKNRIILTAASQDRTSFGCSRENEYTYWDSCLIDSLPKSDNWKSLYGEIQQCVETKESRGHFKPSLPQAYFGEEVADLKIPKTATTVFNALPRRPSETRGNPVEEACWLTGTSSASVSRSPSK